VVLATGAERGKGGELVREPAKKRVYPKMNILITQETVQCRQGDFPCMKKRIVFLPQPPAVGPYRCRERRKRISSSSHLLFYEKGLKLQHQAPSFYEVTEGLFGAARYEKEKRALLLKKGKLHRFLSDVFPFRQVGGGGSFPYNVFTHGWAGTRIGRRGRKDVRPCSETQWSLPQGTRRGPRSTREKNTVVVVARRMPGVHPGKRDKDRKARS